MLDKESFDLKVLAKSKINYSDVKQAFDSSLDKKCNKTNIYEYTRSWWRKGRLVRTCLAKDAARAVFPELGAPSSSTLTCKWWSFYDNYDYVDDFYENIDDYDNVYDDYDDVDDGVVAGFET